MTDLRGQLRTLIEAAAEPVHPAEVSGLRPVLPDTAARRSGRRLAKALAGVAAVALAVLGVAALVAGPDADEGTTTATTGPSAGADPASCYPNPCRDVDDDEASALLGVPVAMPSGIPAGWELVSSEVEFYPAGVEVNGQPPPNPADSVVLRRNWSPPGESWTEGCPTSISLRAVTPRFGDAYAGLGRSTYLTLPDGTPVYGSVGPGVCGDAAGEQVEAGWLTWTHAGVEYGLRSFGAPREALPSIVTSLP
jgi:hypothetical protein